MPKNIYLIGLIFTLTILFVSVFASFIFVQAFGFTALTSTVLYLLSCFMTIVFVVAFVTSRHSAKHSSNYFYIFAMTLGGYGMYLFIVSIPLAVLLTIASFSGAMLPLWIPMSCFILALVLGIVGHIQSWNITTTAYTVPIPNLPPWWVGKRAVLLTDTHFGLVRKERFAQKIVKAITALSPDVVFHGGDFYDGPDIHTAGITSIWKKLADHTPIFYAPGNHELYGDYAAFIQSIHTAGITVLEDTKVVHEGMQISGITYRSKRQRPEAQTVIENFNLNTDMPTILINHPPIFHEEAFAANISLMLSGHTHNGQFWPSIYIARAVFGQYVYGMKKYKDMHAITSRGVGTAGPPMRLFNRPELVVITFTQ